MDSIYNKISFSQNAFLLNPNGISQLLGHFLIHNIRILQPEQMDGMLLVQQDVFATGNTVGHLGGDYYADDWNLSGTLDCGVSFYPFKRYSNFCWWRSNFVLWI